LFLGIQPSGVHRSSLELTRLVRPSLRKLGRHVVQQFPADAGDGVDVLRGLASCSSLLRSKVPLSTNRRSGGQSELFDNPCPVVASTSLRDPYP
jgi:hypothetical protein